MGLKTAARRVLLRAGLPVPEAIVPRKQRLLYRELARLRRGAVVLDFGANVGRTVEAFADRGAAVHGYEPNPDAFVRLTARVGGRPGVRLHNVAVGDRDATVRLYLHRGYEGGNASHLESSSTLAEKGNVDPEAFYDVPQRDVAAIVAEVPGRIDLVKIDVEGGEYAILGRLLDAGLMARIGRVVVETHEDRIASLRPLHAAIEARIAAERLGERIQLEWE
jgi:FkbM family methyltransferase